MDHRQLPLSWSSTSSESPRNASTLPPEVVICLKNARFLHLATCDDQVPHVSLMNYTYLPSSPYTSAPTIIMTTNSVSKKTDNLVANPRVSLLVHDWVSHRPPTQAPNPGREGSPPPRAARSSLASMLLNMNASALSRISATINGEARIVDAGSAEESWYKKMHLENNTFGDQGADSSELFGTSPGDLPGDGGRGHFIEGDTVKVVVVKIKDGRIADWKGAVQDWILTSDEHTSPATSLVNGA